MRTLRRAVQAGIVWLAAATTLIAGVPHFDCICPNGHHKPFCLGLASKPDGCCCGGGCCSSSSGGPCCCCQGSEPGQEAEEGCCPSQGQSNAGASDESSLIAGSCCKKTPAHDESPAVVPTRADTKQELTTGLYALPLEPALVTPAPMVGHCPFSWQSYELPPPTDLVIALQHFLI